MSSQTHKPATSSVSSPHIGTHSVRPSVASVAGSAGIPATPSTPGGNRRNTLNSINSATSVPNTPAPNPNIHHQNNPSNANNNNTNIYSNSDPNQAASPSLLNASILDFLLIEMVPLAQRVVSEVKEMNTPKGPDAVAAAVVAAEKKRDAEKKSQSEAKDVTDDDDTKDVDMKDIKEEEKEEDFPQVSEKSYEYTPLTRQQLHQYPSMCPITDEDVFFRTELYGFRVGKSLAEVVTRDMARLTNQLSVLKFVCKELWVLVYGKPIDNLKTNHRGTYVLIDNSFWPCERMGSVGNMALSSFHKNFYVNGNGNVQSGMLNSSSATAAGGSSVTGSGASTGATGAGTMSAAAPYIWFPLGIIRGALGALGVESTVSFVATHSPAVSFNVHTTNAVKR